MKGVRGSVRAHSRAPRASLASRRSQRARGTQGPRGVRRSATTHRLVHAARLARAALRLVVLIIVARHVVVAVVLRGDRCVSRHTRQLGKGSGGLLSLRRGSCAAPRRARAACAPPRTQSPPLSAPSEASASSAGGGSLGSAAAPGASALCTASSAIGSSAASAAAVVSARLWPASSAAPDCARFPPRAIHGHGPSPSAERRSAGARAAPRRGQTAGAQLVPYAACVQQRRTPRTDANACGAPHLQPPRRARLPRARRPTQARHVIRTSLL